MVEENVGTATQAPEQPAEIAEATTPVQEVVAEPAIEPDYKTLYEKSQTENKEAIAKIEQRLRSAEGVSKQRLNLEAELQRVRTQGERMEEYIVALGAGLAAGDYEVANKNLTDVRTRHAQESAGQSADALRDRLWKTTLLDAADIAGKPADTQAGFNYLDTSPDLAPVKALWVDAWKTKDMPKMIEAVEVLAEARREYQTRQRQAEKKEAETTIKKRLTEAGFHDSPAINASGAGSRTEKELETAVASGKIALTPAIAARLTKYWNT